MGAGAYANGVSSGYAVSAGYWDGQKWVEGSTKNTHIPHKDVLTRLGPMELAGFAKYDVTPWFNGLMLNCSNGEKLGSNPKPIKSYDVAATKTAFDLNKSEYIITSADEVCIQWPDREFPGLTAQFWNDFTVWAVENYTRLVVFCVGGHGRTGTALACILMAAYKNGLVKNKQFRNAKDVSTWVWDKYCEKAIESVAQDNYIAFVAKGLGL